jgi:PKD repeat protein
MRKLTLLIVAIFAGLSMANAGVVSQNTAQTVATNLYTQTFGGTVNSITLAYTERDASGVVSFYAFDINSPTGGFVIVSAEDAGRPIIGYSNTGHYVVPQAGTNVEFWINKRNAEIANMRSLKLIATSDISNEWSAYINNTVPTSNRATHKVLANPFPSSTAYLVKSTWDQQYPPYPYNYFCPPTTTGSTASTQSVTGCVATAMSQIMRYWSYPPKGLGSSSYCDCTSGGYTENYGTLKANYAHTYNWSAMPLTPGSTTTPDTNTARLLSDAGISVQMDYSPTGSGAYVITSENPVCAQVSYTKYFAYSTKIIDGLNAFANATTWQDTLETELNHSRPIEYFGTSSAGGHTWVCDGFNSSNDFHMNWGWSGTDDGWYALNNLNPGGELFNTNLGALVGITPPPLAPVANFTANVTTIPVGTTVNFTDLSTGFPTSWAWTFTGAVTTTSTAQNPANIKYNTVGKYAVSLKVTNSAGTNTASKTAYINVVNGNACDTLSNLPASPYLTYYSTGNGFVSGCYGDTVQKEAEYFSSAPPAGYTIGQVYVFFGKSSSKTVGRTVNVDIWDNTGTGGAPGAVKATKAITLSSIVDTVPTLVTFTSPVTITTPYYVGVDFTLEATNYKTDTVVIITDTTNDGGNPNTAWQYDVAAKYSINGWYQVSAIWNLNISNAIWPVLCSDPTSTFDYDLESGVKLYPNPTSGIVNAEFSLDSPSDVNVEVYNMLGQLVQQAHWGNVSNSTYTINLSGQPTGMYFVKMVSDKSTITKKIMLNNR